MATKLLSHVRPNGPELASQLARVLAVKDQVHYTGDPIPESRMISVLRNTARLVEAAERLLGETPLRGTPRTAKSHKTAQHSAIAAHRDNGDRLPARPGD